MSFEFCTDNLAALCQYVATKKVGAYILQSMVWNLICFNLKKWVLALTACRPIVFSFRLIL